VIFSNSYPFENKMYDYLIHISDIHIRLSSRFEEYQSVFDQFVDSIKDIKNALIVCTGDLFHQKNELTPDCIMFSIKFLRDISKYHKVILIPGNHDFLMNNFHKCDTITSILSERDLTNVDFLRDSGEYRYDNIIFIHNSLWNPDNSEWIDATTVHKNETDTIVSLYHGQVSGCKTQLGYTLKDTISTNNFEGSDIVLLGDIHKHQFLQENMAYAGSMISQNFGETDDEHGYLLWKVVDRTGIFCKIYNEYCYRQVDIFDDRVVYLDKNYDDIMRIVKHVPTHARIQILIHDCPDYDTDKLRKRFHPIQPRIRHVAKSLQFLTISNTTQECRNLEEHMIDYLQLNNLTDPLYIQKLRENIQFDYSIQSSSATWDIVELSFDYLFGYGLDNKIVFSEKSHHIVGIFGCNSIGKSTIIDIILFMLYGRITRYASGNTTPKELIHEKQKTFQATIKIRVSGSVYIIQKKGKRDKHNKIKVDEEIFKETGENLTEEQRCKTDKIIRDLIGPVEQFLSLSMCLQIPDKSFRQMTQKEKKEYIYALFRLDAFESYKTILTEKGKVMQTKMEYLRSQLKNFEEDSDEMFQSKIIQDEEEYVRMKNELNIIEEERKKLDEQWTHYTSLTTRQKYLQKYIEDIRIRCNYLEKEIVKRKTIPDAEEDLTTIQNQFHKNKNKVSGIKNIIDKLHSQRKNIPSAPSIDNFSYSQYKRFNNRYTYTVSIPIVSISNDNFSYFRKRSLLDELQQMDDFEKHFMKKIKKYYVELDKISLAEKTTCITEERILEEYKIHEKVEYNDSCEKCMCNPFRDRKVFLENKLEEHYKQKKELTTQKRKYQHKIMNKINTILDVECIDNFENEWDKKRNEIKQSINEIEMVDKMLRLFCQKRINDVLKKECDLYQQSSTFLKNLGNFLKIKTMNNLIDYDICEKKKELNILEKCVDDDQKLLIRLVNNEQYNRLVLELNSKRIDYEKGNNELINITKEVNSLQNIGELKMKKDKEWVELSRKESLFQNNIEQKKIQYQEWRNLIKKRDKLLLEFSIIKNLIYVTDRNGFPSYMLKMLIPDLNRYMNDILTNFTERQIKFDLSDDGEVLFHTRSGSSDLMIHFYGGMESLMIDLATKITFSHFSYCPMSSFFILDENISVLDESHIQNIEILFDFLKQHYKHILLISHLPQMKNIVDKNITITKTNEYSKINCTL
jgi:DNA repair exonuclease SbcCD ATPase subunit